MVWRGASVLRTRAAGANAFVIEAVLGSLTTMGMIERLTIDRALRRICGFPLCKTLPCEATFSRAFDEFAEVGQRCWANA